MPKNNTYSPILNPLIPLFRFLFLLFLGGIIIYALNYFWKKPELELEIIVPFIIIASVYSLIIVIIFHKLWMDFKIVRFENNEVIVTYILRFKKVRFIKKDIEGFTICDYFDKHNSKSLVLYSKNKVAFDLKIGSYLRFKDMETYIKEEFKFLGRDGVIFNTCVGYDYTYKK